MAAAWYRFRAELRVKWRATFALAVLVGLTGGIVLVAVAGARRTDTAYTRLEQATNASDVLVNPDAGTDSALRARDIVRLPQVAAAGREDGVVLVPADSRSPSDFGRYGTVLARDRNAGRTIGRAKILSGREPDPGRADEVLVNRVLARQQHLHVGSTIRTVALTRAQMQNGDDAAADISTLLAQLRAGTYGQPITLHVTGIGVTPDEIVVDEGFESPSMLLTPAFLQRHPETAVEYWGEIVRLHRGAADVAQFRKEVNALVPKEAIAYQTATVTAAKVARAVEPAVGALTIFAVVMALTGLLVVGQALARQVYLGSVDFPALRALGFARHQRFAAAMLRAALIAVAGAVLAVLVAVALSPLTPIGAARTAEPHPGVHADALVLGLGGLVVVAVVLALAAVPSWRYASSRAANTRDEALRPSQVAASLGGFGAPIALTSGVRMALETGRGRTAVPVRTTVVGAMLAIATVTGAVVFAASLDHLVSTPRLYGWNWDVRIDAGADSPQQDAVATRALSKMLRASPAVAGFAATTQSDVVLDGHSVPAIGVEARGGAVGPSLVSGRIPRGDHEIALGSRTADQLGVAVGGVVHARSQSGAPQDLRVVGRVVLPGFGTYSGADKTSLGEGAVVTEAALAELGPDFSRHPFLVDFVAGADRAPVLARARSIISVANSAPSGLEVSSVQRPSDIIAYNHLKTTPVLLAAALAVLALATIGHALVTATRRRRRDLAMLKTLGFTRRQVSSAVAWQATTIGAIALAVGLPAGVVLGRWSWQALSDSLGTVAEPIVPLAGLIVAIPVVLALVNLVAFVPGRVAARLRPATALRSE